MASIQSATSQGTPDTLFIQRMTALVHQVKSWMEEADWSTRIIDASVPDAAGAKYVVPGLLMQHETVKVLLEPIAGSTPQAAGVADLYRLPAYDDISRLVLIDEDWFVVGEPTHSAADDSNQGLRERLTKSLLIDRMAELVADAR
jgi:hypothetical protein